MVISNSLDIFRPFSEVTAPYTFKILPASWEHTAAAQYCLSRLPQEISADQDKQGIFSIFWQSEILL